MQWLNKVVEAAMARKPEGEIIVESGISPSGAYHMGYLREIITCDAIINELKNRDRQAKHIHYVDDLDGFRKVPAGLSADYKKYLGRPLADMPAPDSSDQSYADYALKDFLASIQKLGVKMDVVRSHQKYREGFYVPAIERALEASDKVRSILETISGHKLGEEWSPVQVNEGGYLKKRKFVSIDKQAKIITYEDRDGQNQSTGYAKGDIKLDWRIDWPARWWLVGVDVEPFGRDHATKGGSYDTGAALMQQVFKAPAPIPVPYNFINQAGQSKKISASSGGGLSMADAVAILPPEVIRFFILRFPPDKQLSFDPIDGVTRLIDEFAELIQKKPNDPLVKASLAGISDPVVSSVPFSLLAESYQAALRDPGKTLEILSRSEYRDAAAREAGIIKKELEFISGWLDKWAPEDVKFELAGKVDSSKFSETEKNYLSRLADSIEKLPENSDGEAYHKAIYAFNESDGFTPQQLFGPLYRALIGKNQGPRAGWFLAMLPRDWLIKRLRLEA